MANPQKEHGFTAIANEILEALMNFHLSGTEWQILLVILRKTYGWGKKVDRISMSMFAMFTDMSRSNCCRAVNGLVDKNILVKHVNPKKTYLISYEFQKDYEQWRCVPKWKQKKWLKCLKTFKGVSKLNTDEDMPNIINLGQVYYSLMYRWQEKHKDKFKHSYPESKKKLMNQFKAFYNKFNEQGLWQAWSISQEDHCLKLIDLFYEIGPENQWNIAPENLLQKAPRLQKILLQGDDGVYSSVKEQKQKQKDNETVRHTLAWYSDNRSFENLKKVARKLSQRLHDKFAYLLMKKYGEVPRTNFYRAVEKIRKEKK